MNIPEQVKNEARVLIEQYGDTFEYLGIYEGQEAYVFKFPGLLYRLSFRLSV